MSNRLAHEAGRRSLAMGPSVRNLLLHYNLKPELITSTGPHQTLLKGDVLAYIGQHKIQPGQSHDRVQSSASSGQPSQARIYTPNLDLSGHQPEAGPKGFSRIAKKLLDM